MANKPSDAQVARSSIEKLLSGVTPTPWSDNGLSDRMKISRITKHMTSILNILGLDLTDDSLEKTPHRLAKMWVNELFSGLKPENFPKMTTIQNKMGADQMISISEIRVLSVCEHHFVSIDGYATVAYIPGDKIIGLSKINRVVEYFSRRPQVQERLTTQIADCLQKVLGTKNVAVHIKAKHYCVISRGVGDKESQTTTADLRGIFRTDSAARSEFLRTTRR